MPAACGFVLRHTLVCGCCVLKYRHTHRSQQLTTRAATPVLAPLDHRAVSELVPSALLLSICMQAPPGSPPDVWAQLQRWCLHKIQLSSPVTEPPREKVKKSSRVIRWLIRCITD